MILRRDGSAVVLRWSTPEADQLIDLFDGVSGLLADADAADGVDPARTRLLPDGHRDDPAAAAAFRELTEVSLIAAKRSALATCIGELAAADPEAGADPEADVDAPPADRLVRLDGAGLQRWLQALNDVRLALGTRLESLGADLAAGRPPADLPRDDIAEAAEAMWMVYGWLTAAQDDLVEAAMSGSGGSGVE